MDNSVICKNQFITCHAGANNQKNENNNDTHFCIHKKRKRRRRRKRRKSLGGSDSQNECPYQPATTMAKFSSQAALTIIIIIIMQLICDTGRPRSVHALIQDSDSVYSSGFPTSTNSYPPQQQLSKLILSTQYNNNNNHSSNHLMMASANTASSSSFSVVQRSDPYVRIKQGDSLILSCKLDRPTDSHLWLRNNKPLAITFIGGGQQEHQAPSGRRVVTAVDETLYEQGDYSINLDNLQPEDSGNYSCQIGHDTRTLSIWTQLTVDPTPTQSPFTAPAAHSTLVNSYSSLSQVSASDSSPSLSNELDSLSSASTSSKSSFVNNNKAREAILGLPHLPADNQQLIITASGHTKSPSSGSTNANGIHHQYTHHQYASVRASSASPSSGLLASSSSVSSNSGGINFHNMALVWPYLLLALAALLMLANVYLIFSLIKRHTRCSKEREANEDRGSSNDGAREDEDPSLA